MKKFVLKSFIFLFLVAAVMFLPAYILDPYNVFHYENPRNNGVELNKNFAKTKYILNHQDLFDSLVFGSSRAGFLDVSRIPNGSYYNMYSSEAVPAEHVKTLKILLKHGYCPKNILVLVDDISCFVDPAEHESILYRLPYPDGNVFDHMEFYTKYCDAMMLAESIPVMRSFVDLDSDYGNRFRTTGTERLDITPDWDGLMDGASPSGYWADYYELRVDEALSDMQELVDLCNANGISLTVATNPLYCVTYKRSAEAGYLEFLRGLAEVTDYYGFSSLSDITNNYTCYYETSHYSPYVGHKMIEVIYEDQTDPYLWSQGFGISVNSENIDEYITFLESQL